MFSASQYGKTASILIATRQTEGKSNEQRKKRVFNHVFRVDNYNVGRYGSGRLGDVMETLWTIARVILAIYAFWLVVLGIQCFYIYRAKIDGKLFAVRRRWFHKLTGRK